MKHHLKRIAAPKSWIIDRRKNVYIVRPTSGGHALGMGLPLGLVLRDVLKVASTMTEVKKMLHTKSILIDGKRRKEYSFMVGIFDVITFPDTGKSYRVAFDTKGRVIVSEINGAELSIKPCKIIGKTALAGKKIQFHLHDGKNIIMDKDAKVGDTLLLQLPTLEVKDILPLQSGAAVFLTKGDHRGDIGVLKEIHDRNAVYIAAGQEIETTRDYLFVVGG